MNDPAPASRAWRERLPQVWPQLDDAVRDARRRREDSPAQLAALKINFGWIDSVSDWACPRRGLGDFARFVLFRYRLIKEIKGKAFCVPEGLKNVRKMPDKSWVASIQKQNPEHGTVVVDLMRRFDTQHKHDRPLACSCGS